MRSFSKILLPVDFSERSTGAARYAQALARHFQAELILLHVLTPPNYEFGALEIAGSMLDELYRNRAEQASKELDAFLTAEPPGLKVRRMVLEGDPAKKIVDLARDEASGHHHHADPRLRAVPAVHPGVEHRQGAARRRLPGVDGSASGASPGIGFHSVPQHLVRRGPGSAKLHRRSTGRLGWRGSSGPAWAWCTRPPAFPIWATIPNGSGGPRPAPRPGGSCSVSWTAWARKPISRLKLESRRK